MTQEEKRIRQTEFPLRYDNTLRTLFHSCRRKFYWWKIRKIDYSVKPAYFSWGTAWHEAKGAWYLSQSAQPTLEPFSPEWELEAAKALHKGLQSWDNSGAIGAKYDTRENLIRLFSKYVKQYPREPWHLVRGGAELGWLWPLASQGGQPSPYFLGGSLDGYIEWDGYGMMPLEEKTTGIWLSDFYMMQWRFSSQITQYIWYLSNLLGTEAVHGALINMATKQEVKGSGTTPQFGRTIETRSEEDLLEFERDWWEDIHAIERAWDRWHFPKTTDTVNCVGGIGKVACQYRGFCLSGLPTDLIEPSSFPNLCYRKEDWNPWGRGMLPSSLASKRSPKGEIPQSLLNTLATRNLR
jgi:hypothetical protein